MEVIVPGHKIVLHITPYQTCSNFSYEIFINKQDVKCYSVSFWALSHLNRLVWTFRLFQFDPNINYPWTTFRKKQRKLSPMKTGCLGPDQIEPRFRTCLV